MLNDSTTGGPLAPENSTPTLSDDAAFDTFIQGFVAGITGMPGNLVRPRWQQVPAPEPEVTTDWCAVGVVDETTEALLGYTTHSSTADGGVGADFVQVNDEVKIMASFYGPNARGNAKRLTNGLRIGQNLEALTLQNYGLASIGQSRFVPAIVNMQTQRRVDVDFAIRRADVSQVPVRNLVGATGALYGDNRITENFTQGATPPP